MPIKVGSPLDIYCSNNNHVMYKVDSRIIDCYSDWINKRGYISTKNITLNMSGTYCCSNQLFTRPHISPNTHQLYYDCIGVFVYNITYSIININNYSTRICGTIYSPTNITLIYFKPYDKDIPMYKDNITYKFGYNYTNTCYLAYHYNRPTKYYLVVSTILEPGLIERINPDIKKKNIIHHFNITAILFEIPTYSGGSVKNYW